MRIATFEEVTASIDEHARREPGGAVVFDGDGTLWSGDIGDDYFAALITRGLFSEEAHAALAREAAEVKLDATGTAAEIAKRIHDAYLADAFPEERVCEIMTWASAGFPKDEVYAFAASALEAVSLASRLHGETIRVAKWAASRGLAVYLVSASPRAIVEAAGRLVGIDADHVAAATELRDSSGMVLTAVDRPIPYGPGKVTRLREKLGSRVLYAAFGDNAFDVSMLKEARVPVAIRPKARLVDRAAEVPGLVTLERV